MAGDRQGKPRRPGGSGARTPSAKASSISSTAEGPSLAPPSWSSKLAANSSSLSCAILPHALEQKTAGGSACGAMTHPYMIKTCYDHTWRWRQIVWRHLGGRRLSATCRHPLSMLCAHAHASSVRALMKPFSCTLVMRLRAQGGCARQPRTTSHPIGRPLKVRSERIMTCPPTVLGNKGGNGQCGHAARHKPLDRTLLSRVSTSPRPPINDVDMWRDGTGHSNILTSTGK